MRCQHNIEPLSSKTALIEFSSKFLHPPCRDENRSLTKSIMQSIKHSIFACLFFFSFLAQIVTCDAFKQAQPTPLPQLSQRFVKRFTNSSTSIQSSTLVTSSSSIIIISSSSQTTFSGISTPARPTSSHGPESLQGDRPPFPGGQPPGIPDHDSPFHMSTGETVGLWVGVGCACVLIATGLIFSSRILSAWRVRSARKSYNYKLPQ